MFAQKSIKQQINNDIFINSTLMQIEKGIDLYINKFDINKDTSMTIQHDLMGLSINISFSAHHHYASAKCAFKIIPKAGYTVTKTQAEAEALTADSGKAIVIDEHLADSDAMSYES